MPMEINPILGFMPFERIRALSLYKEIQKKFEKALLTQGKGKAIIRFCESHLLLNNAYLKTSLLFFR